MSTGEQPAVTVIEERTKKTLADVRWLLGLGVGSIVAIFAAGASTLAQAQDAGRAAAKEETAGIATEQAALKANVKDLREEVADVKAELRGVRQDLRMFQKGQKLPDLDGGR